MKLTTSTSKILKITILILAMTSINMESFAGTTGEVWKPLAALTNEWLDGYLGKAVAVGGGMAAVVLGKFSTMSWIAAAGVGVAMSQLPTVLNSMVTATLL